LIKMIKNSIVKYRDKREERCKGLGGEKKGGPLLLSY